MPENKKETIHLHNYGKVSACGLYLNKGVFVTDVKEVTCGNCKQSKLYKEMLKKDKSKPKENKPMSENKNNKIKKEYIVIDEEETSFENGFDNIDDAFESARAYAQEYPNTRYDVFELIKSFKVDSSVIEYDVE